ncbi:hypothetical protein GPL17_36835 [Bradyrhizobium yuanmingense]|uniref:hypothetical protein n=1 Tax=Bradyrhizobium yuanmingense TaxID=108015 RepID=UPI0012FC8828|nr:hypothetical protein [Bradyrhizobium yuanmingense]MVT55946.1 hypothetical protein [Bradyrhizobium yuanmingense]
MPVFILFLDIGELSRSRCDIYRESCAWSLLLNTIAAVKQVEPLRITSARAMRAMPQQLSVILPAALPTIVVGIRLASASVMRVLVASDVKGLFHHQEPVQFLIPQMYPRDYSRRAYVQGHPAGIEGFHTMESAGLCLMVSRAPLQGTDELVAPFSNRVCIYQPCLTHDPGARSYQLIASDDGSDGKK